MGWELYSAKSEFSRFTEDWDRLNTRLYKGHPFLDSRFVGALLDHFSIGNEVLCLHREQGIISGALILQPGGWGRWISFRPSQAQITAVLLDNSLHIKSLFAALPKFTWTIELHAIDPRFSPEFNQLNLPMISHGQAHTIGIELNGSFSDFWNKRPKKLIANIDRYYRRTDKEFGPSLLSEFSAVEEMEAGVRRFGELESAGWKGAAGTAISIENQQGIFYSEVLRRFSLTKQAGIYELFVGEKLASSRLIISSDEMIIFLKTTYDESLSRIAPGRILLHKVIEDLFPNHSGRTIEFYTNATRDQKEWASFGCTIQNFQIFRNSFFSNGFATLKAFQNSLRKTTNQKSIPEEISMGACTDVESLRTLGIRLEDYPAVDTVEISLDWFDLLQKTIYRDDPSVRYYHASVDNRPPTILPLRLSRQGWVKTVEGLSNFYTSLYSPLQATDGDRFTLRHLLAAATDDHKGAHVMRFAPMDCASPAYTNMLNELRAIGWIPFSFVCFGNWFLEVADGWHGYLKNRSANLRSTIKRRNKNFDAGGGTLEIVTETDKIEPAIIAFQEVYSASWKTSEPYPEFIPSLIRLLATKGALRLGIARMQGKPVAAQIWIVTAGKASIFKLAYHEAYAGYSPGTVLTGHLLQYVIEQDHVSEVDFLKGDDKHKRIWMSHRRERKGIVAYNPSTFIGLALLMKELLGRIAKTTREKLFA